MEQNYAKDDAKLTSDLPAPPPVKISTIPLTFAKELASVPPSESECYEFCMTSLGNCFGCLGAYAPCLPCFASCNPYIKVPQGNSGVLTKFGKAYRIVDPGLYFVNKMTEQMHIVDVKIRINELPRQMVMTKDNVSVLIDSVVYWHIIDPFTAQFQVADVTSALMERTMTTLRDTVGSHTLQNVIENREALAVEIRKIIDDAARSWGVIVESILIKDLTFSTELQETLSSAAKQQRIGESKIIAARAEVQAARLMREASDILNTPAAMQIRYLETMHGMAKHSANKVIFMAQNADGETAI